MQASPDASVVVPERSCDLCGSARAEVVSRYDRRGRPLRTLLCSDCGLVFTDPRPGPPELEHYYRDDYRQEYKGARLPRAMQVYRNVVAAADRLERIRRYLSDEGRLLDIGSGSGEFLYLVREAGYRVQGIEPDAGYSAYTSERLGLDVESRPLKPPAPEAAPFSTITIFHVLEHLPNPGDALAILRSWLEEGGALVVEVPNIESRCTAPHHRFHRAHLFHFNVPTLSAMGEMSGLKVVEAMTAPDGGTVTVVFTRGSPDRPSEFRGNAARVRASLDGYTNLRHYLGGTLVRQQVRKLRHNLAGRWVCRGVSDPARVLERTMGLR